MPKGEYTRPLTPSARKKLSDPSGRANEALRRAAASGDPKKYTSAPTTPEEFADEMRRRERGKGTAYNKGYVSATHDSEGDGRNASDAAPDAQERLKRLAKRLYNKSNHKD